jgi:hypothetical protein
VERERPASWVLDVYLYNSTSCFNNGIPSCKNNKEVIAKKFLLASEGTDCRIKTEKPWPFDFLPFIFGYKVESNK